MSRPAAVTIDPEDRGGSGGNAPRFPYRGLPGRFSVLLAVLVIYLLCYPFVLDGNYWNVMGVLAGLAIVAAMYALSDHRKWWLSGMLLAMPALVHHLSLKPELTSRFDVFGLVCSVLFDVFMTVFILYVIFGHKTVRRETIFGALSAYLAIGFAFANIYRVLVHYLPTSIYLDPLVNAHKIAQRADLIYYSFSSLTCLGASGFVPANSYARALTSFEAVVGVMYLAVLVARLIGLHTAQQRA
jgi:voltage-gated potassium channel